MNVNHCKRALIAEDSPEVAKRLTELLSEVLEIEISGIAADGAQALAMFRALSPELVILDIGMPILNGVEVLKAIREENANVEVIMFTNHSDQSVRELCMKRGANHFVDKARGADELIEVLERYVGAKRRPTSAAS